MPLHAVPDALNIVYDEKKYLALSLATAPLLAYLLVLATSIPGQTLESWWFSAPAYTKFLVFFAASVLSVILTMQVYTWKNYKKVKKRHTTGGLAGVAATLAATACCSPLLLPLAGVAGFGGFLFFVQTHQLAVVILSSLALLASLYFTSKAVSCEDCRVKAGLEKNVKNPKGA
ncbi:hypothetical protein HY572_02315 [Candidatus Micrarchaeota archaeon]|nr:hypothetical protein [Candidatus Micrarchaeota archaeon]